MQDIIHHNIDSSLIYQDNDYRIVLNLKQSDDILFINGHTFSEKLFEQYTINTLRVSEFSESILHLLKINAVKYDKIFFDYTTLCLAQNCFDEILSLLKKNGFICILDANYKEHKIIDFFEQKYSQNANIWKFNTDKGSVVVFQPLTFAKIKNDKR